MLEILKILENVVRVFKRYYISCNKSKTKNKNKIRQMKILTIRLRLR
jgi:hypothetical protein